MIYHDAGSTDITRVGCERNRSRFERKSFRRFFAPSKLFHIVRDSSRTWKWGSDSSCRSSLRSRLYLCPGAERTASMTSLLRTTASPFGIRDGDTTVQLILSNSCSPPKKKRKDTNWFKCRQNWSVIASSSRHVGWRTREGSSSGTDLQ